MLEHSLEAVAQKAHEMGFKGYEIAQLASTYNFALGYFRRHNPRPSYKENSFAVVKWNEDKFREAYKICMLRIQREVDEWHIKKKE